MKSTRRALISSALSFLLCLAMFAGTTFAWFSVSVTSGKNRIESASLDIQVLHKNANITEAVTLKDESNLFCDEDGKAMLWEPGSMSYECITIENKGDLSAQYGLSLAVADYNAIKGSNPAKTLKDVLKIMVLTGDDCLETITREGVLELFWKNKSVSIDDLETVTGNLYTEENNNSAEIQIFVYWEMSDIDSDYNLAQGVTTTDGSYLFVKFGINVVATQLNVEEDAFDDDYDKSMLLPTMPNSIDKSFASKPLVINYTDSTTTPITYSGTESVTVINENDSDATVATVPAAAVKSIVECLGTGIAPKSGTDVTTVLTLAVKTNEATETSASYSIELTAKMSYVDEYEAKQENSLTAAEVDDLLCDNIVTATLNVGTYLENVTVTHGDANMTKLGSASTDAEGFYYDKLTGILTIKTKTFSPFVLSFTAPAPRDTEAVITVKKGSNEYACATLNGVDFMIGGLADNQFADGKTEINVTITEVRTTKGAWKITFKDGSTVCYKISIDDGYAATDPDMTLYIKSATNVSIDSKAAFKDGGYGPSETLNGFTGSTFYASYHLQKNTTTE